MIFTLPSSPARRQTFPAPRGRGAPRRALLVYCHGVERARCRCPKRAPGEDQRGRHAPAQLCGRAALRVVAKVPTSPIRTQIGDSGIAWSRQGTLGKTLFVHIDIHGTAHPKFLTPSVQWQRSARLGQYQLTVVMRNARRAASPFCSDNDSSARRRRSRCSSVGAGCNNAQQSNRTPSRGAPSAATYVPAQVLIAEERAWTSFYCDS